MQRKAGGHSPVNVNKYAFFITAIFNVLSFTTELANTGRVETAKLSGVRHIFIFATFILNILILLITSVCIGTLLFCFSVDYFSTECPASV